MEGKIYLVGSDNTLTPMQETEYAAEELLQVLLAEHPDLLAGDQMDADAPRRWLLIEREIGVPDVQDGGDRWTLDDLFLDQDGIPTLVEVKRSSDTRARREVVAQMLDYAANAVAYWPVEGIRARLEERCAAAGADTADELARVVADPTTSEDDFWSLVKTNLGAGRIRMIFVADRISRELRRIVEFLNEQMDPAEVLAVEVRSMPVRAIGPSCLV